MVKYTYFFLLHRIPLSIYYAHGKKENTTPKLHDCRAPEYPRMRNIDRSRSTHVPLHQGDIYYWSVFCNRRWKAFLSWMVSLDIFSDYRRTRNDDSREKGFLVCNTFCRAFYVFHHTHIIYRTFERWDNRAFWFPWEYGDIPREICRSTHTHCSLLREPLYDTPNLLQNHSFKSSR